MSSEIKEETVTSTPENLSEENVASNEPELTLFPLKEVIPETPAPYNPIVDLGLLYTTSGQVDKIGATAQVLLSVPENSNEARKNLIKEYNSLLPEIKASLHPNLHTEFDAKATRVSEEADLSVVFVNASRVSHWLNLQNTQSQFVLGTMIAMTEGHMKYESLAKAGLASYVPGPVSNREEPAPKGPIGGTGFQKAPAEPKTGHYM